MDKASVLSASRTGCENSIARSKSRQWVAYVLLAALIGLLYKDTFQWLFDQWVNDRVYSHGFIVPLICFYLVWIQRDRLQRIPAKPNFIIGGMGLLLAAPLLVVGRVGVIVQAEAVSLFLLFPSIVLFVWGYAHLRALALPLFYVQFMIPWMDPFLDRIQWPFQLISAEIGSFILKALGYPVYHDSIYIQLPKLTMLVARECSGINFLISVLAIALPLVYLSQRSWWTGIGVILCGLAITVFANGTRVALAGVSGSNYGVEMLHGPGHIWRGWFAAQVGWVCVFVVNWLAMKIPSRSELRLHEKWREKERAVSPEGGLCQNKGLVIIILLSALLGVFLYVYALPKPVPVKEHLSMMPTVLGKWDKGNSKLFAGKGFFPGASVELDRAYLGTGGEKLHLYIAYFESQNHGRRLVSYHDEPLYRKARKIETRLQHPAPEQVNRSIVNIDNQEYEMILWYRLPSGTLADRSKAKLKTLTNGLIHRKGYGAAIILAKKREHGRDEGILNPDLKAFLNVISPVLNAYLP